MLSRFSTFTWVNYNILTNLNEAIGDDFPYHPSRAESGEVVI